ncbi:MAG: hypothetical protein K1X47_13620, partial [Cyclobacteriaceae bacterium]|nr:hypothetical protein [Cyclobacteriaceae bacterium]
MGEGLEELQQKIGRYRRRYYLDLAIRGVIFTGIALISYFLIAALAEHALWFNSWMRFGILVAFVCLVAYCLWIFLGKPLRWWISGAGLEDETVARLIGTRFPSIADRLLNALQLSKDPSPLAKASVLTRSEEFRTVAFEETIRLDENKKYLKYLWPLLLVILLILIFNQKILTGSTDRIVHFSQHYSPQAPFQFKILNDELAAYYNEDFELGVRLEGEALPEAVYIVSDGRELKMIRLPDGRFTYTFEKLQQEIAFQLKAAGFYSEPSRIGMLMRPEMTSLRMDLSFPRYTNRKREELTNQGNLSVPEGTVVHWRIGTQHTKTGLLKIGQQQIPLQEFGNQLFEATNTFRDPQQYQIILQHDSIRNREPIVYQVEVIKDHYPEIVATPYLDSVQLSQLFVSGLIRDDYGFSKLLLGYQIVKAGKQQPLVEKHIPMQTTSITQNFFYRLPIDSLQLGAGDELRYFVEVWDNDQVNGSKAARSSLFTLTLPGREELYDKVREGETSETRDIDRGVQKAQSLRESIQEMTQRLKGKQQLDWQDKSMLEQIVQQKNELQELVQKLSEENKKL